MQRKPRIRLRRRFMGVCRVGGEFLPRIYLGVRVDGELFGTGLSTLSTRPFGDAMVTRCRIGCNWPRASKARRTGSKGPGDCELEPWTAALVGDSSQSSGRTAHCSPRALQPVQIAVSCSNFPVSAWRFSKGPTAGLIRVSTYGYWATFAVVRLSCLASPIIIGQWSLTKARSMSGLAVVERTVEQPERAQAPIGSASWSTPIKRSRPRIHTKSSCEGSLIASRFLPSQ